VTEIKSIPYVPLSHPFVERLIGAFVVHNNPLYIQVKIVKRTVASQKRIPVNNSLLK
jgi:hypothetical protein